MYLFSEGGVFQLLMTFPETYPMSPPELRFVSEFWHPNGVFSLPIDMHSFVHLFTQKHKHKHKHKHTLTLTHSLMHSLSLSHTQRLVYKDGRVCISILHPPGEDAMSGELPEERWLPTQTVSSIMLSVISMLSDPNISSPANVDASVQWRDQRAKFKELCKQLVEKANK
jgi:ubiquitin-conjugating enzyme E2 R